MLYLDVAKYVRERTFDVFAPAFYHPHHSSDSVQLNKKRDLQRNRLGFVSLNQLNPAPFRQVEDPDQMLSSAYTIEIMIDMHRKGVVFEIVHDKDVVEIFDTLDRYLLSLQHDVTTGVERSIAYARLVVAWRKEVYKHYYRYMKQNPGAMEELYPNNDRDNNIFSLMMAIGGFTNKDYEIDPLKARMDPPYDIDKIRPHTKQEVSDDPFAQSAEAVRRHNQEVQVDEPFKFEFEKFVNG